ncbi:MAG: pirin family protein [Desulfovibrio sp.]|jgi:redox-sensitive bicupin YhaK (pirin superfamily)|nr:pirin family protein [Desulfovibrio sp.]
MIRLIDSKKMGRGSHGWLESYFHFSFAEYRNPDNMQFGVLRVVNDDMVRPGTGFDTHSHADMEIISYVIDGELTHADSMGNRRTLTRGQVQYMSAGAGVSHSEHNLGKDMLRFLQIWIFPDQKGLSPNYGDVRFSFADRENVWLPIATGVNNGRSPAPVRVHADINAYAASADPGRPLEFAVSPGRQAYMVFIEGKALINGVALSARDALEIVEENILVTPEETAHMVIIEMARA